MSTLIQVDKECPFCGKENSMSVDMNDYAKWQGGLNIQYAFPDMNSFDREVLQSGICNTCQEQVFGRPAPENEDMWGEELGECPECGAPVYSNHNAMGGTLKCSHCYISMILDKDMGILLEEE